MESPVEVMMVKGEVSTVKISSQEPQWSVNFKKALVAMLKIQLPIQQAQVMPYVWTVLEQGIEGNCETNYQVSELPDYEYEYELPEYEYEYEQGMINSELCQGEKFYQVKKTRDITKCKEHSIFISSKTYKKCLLGYCNGVNTKSSNTRYFGCGESMETLQLHGMINEGELQHNVLAFNTEPVVTGTKQVLKLVDIKPVTSIIPQIVTPKTLNDLLYEFSFPKVSNMDPSSPVFLSDSDLESMSKVQIYTKIIERLTTVATQLAKIEHFGKKEIPSQLESLKTVFSIFTIEDLRAVYSSVMVLSVPDETKEIMRTLLLETVKMTGTGPCIMFFREVIETEQLLKQNNLPKTYTYSIFDGKRNGRSDDIELIEDVEPIEDLEPIEDVEPIERGFDFGNHLKLIMGFNPDLNDEEDTEDVPDYIQHDCNTIRPFNDMEDWLAQERTWRTKGGENVKYNHAYGIPIVGKEYFTEDSMRRACYLVRFLFADNEQFRRYAYKSKMYIMGEKGGICCPANVGNSGLSCPCEKYPNPNNPEKTNQFPIKQIKTSAHEMAHWYIKRVLPLMQKAGKLKLPEFINSPEWSWTTPYDGPYEDDTTCKGVEKISKKEGPLHDYIWNSLQQDTLKETTKIDRCNNHHYFIYTGQDKFLGLASGGEPKEDERKNGRENNANVHNLLEIIWPCNNKYISVCEDSAYGMTKGLTQKFLIGKSDPANPDPNHMICEDIDTSEIEEEEMNELSPLPTNDVYDVDKAWSLDKCLKVTKEGGFLTKKETFSDLISGVVATSLVDSNEYGWWLRKCCAKSAKFQ